MMSLKFGPRFAQAAMDSWIKARIKHAPGVVSDIAYNGIAWSYTIKLP